MRALVKRFGPVGLGPLTAGGGACAAGGCAGIPMVLATPVAAAVLGGTVAVVHVASGLLFGPLSLLLLVRSYLRHRRIPGVLAAGAGVVLMLVHYASHFHRGTHGDEPWMYAGAALLMSGAILDLLARRRVRLRPPRQARAGLIALLLALGPVLAGGLAAGQTLGAVATLRDASGQAVGRAVLAQSLPGGGVWIQVTAAGLIPGLHGIHIHAVGACTGPGLLSAGGHFNPEGLKHGLASIHGAHAGDLPNLIASADGRARYEAANYRITLGPGSSSLFDVDGSAIVIHAQADDHLTDPAGNAGARVLCGVIEKAAN